LRLRAEENLHKAQARYKKSIARGIVRKNTDLSVGDEAYLRVEVTDVGRNHKLESLVQDPYRVVENAGTTLRLSIGDGIVRISSDRVTRAPTRSQPLTATPTPETSSDPVTPTPAKDNDAVPRMSRSPRRVWFALSEVTPDPTEREYVLDRIVDAQMNDRSRILFQVRWLGYDPTNDTWEDKEDLLTHFIRRYWRIKGFSTLEREKTLY
jgi:Chromo (CHRromatin Organisation MOdifier) domain